jgi:AcrR family transcriptional regulator
MTPSEQKSKRRASQDTAAKASGADGTRERILDVARTLFTKQGFTNTSTRAIASAAHCNISLIPYYFGSKEGLLEAVGLSVAQSVSKKIEILKQSKHSPEKQLELFVDFALAHVRENSKFLSFMFKTFIAEGRPPPKLILDQLQKNIVNLTTVIQKLQDNGSMNADISPELAVSSLMGMVMFHNIAEPIISLIHKSTKEDSQEHINNTIKTIFLSGVLAKTPRGGRHS